MTANLPLLRLWLGVWVLVSVATVWLRWRRGALGVGLVFSYLLQMWVIHGLAAAIYGFFPWYEHFDPKIVENGFLQASCGFVALGMGSGVIGPFLARQLKLFKAREGLVAPDPRLAKMYIGIGLACYGILLPLSAAIPSATALSAAGWRLVTAGLALVLWGAWREGANRKFLVWLFGSCIGLPLLTVVTQGFLGFGAVIVLTLLAFVGSFFRPRWKIVILGLLLSYIGLSVYVTYMRDRENIREAVWGGSSLQARLDELQNSFKTMEWFDPRDEDHLERIDGRLNQNLLVGAAVDHLASGYEEFARGQTLWEAFLSLIPRVFWVEKKIIAGSSDLVSQYTGKVFAEGTSVGIGQVMEFYVNFGTASVILGFLFLGIVVAILDLGADSRLKKGDWSGFIYFYLPGLSLIETGGSLVEAVSGAGAGVTVAFLVNKFLLRRFLEKDLTPREEKRDLERS